MTEPQPVRPSCPRHPDRESRLLCQRCGRPTCPDCQVPAPVGFHCVDCVAQARSSHPRAVTPFGGAVTDGRPLVTYVLVALCAVVYVAELAVPSVVEAGFFAPILGRSEPWRLVTAAFLHDPRQPLHIVFNMLCLWQLGGVLEPLFGRARFLAVYLTCAVGGSLGFLLFAFPPQSFTEAESSLWTTPTLGASGAVFGLFAVLLVVLRHLGRSSTGLLVLLGLNAALPLIYPNIAWQAHLGGFVTGVVLALVLLATRERSRRRLQWPALLLVAGVVVVGIVGKYALSDDTFLLSVFGQLS